MAEFEKGKSGNPKGRPKGIQDRSKLIEELFASGQVDKALTNNEEDLSSKETKIRREATRWTLEMTYGKAPQTVQHSGDIDLTGVKFGIDNTNKH